MSARLLFKRFLSKPLQIAYVVPSSPALIRRVVKHMNFETAEVIVEFGPGEGCVTREFVQRMRPDARLLLFEIDDELVGHLQQQFSHDKRIEIIHGDAQSLRNELDKRGLSHCDYVVSGIPFSYIERDKKRAFLQVIYDSLRTEAGRAFIVYQTTTELKQHAQQFPQTDTFYCLQNFPPMFVTTFYKTGPAHHHGRAETANGKRPKAK